ncbi:DUF664 domain-containing protein [Kitasatospora sp. NPDC094016]|uniref:DUF664 domain-containing protein n=1 Tax=Kitasatospora sp. NPDC094016 TaxID=3154986 RepID=UPI00332F7D61
MAEEAAQRVAVAHFTRSDDFRAPAVRLHTAAQGQTEAMWASEHETREEIIGRYRRVAEHSDATIDAPTVEAPGYVPWWPRPDVTSDSGPGWLVPPGVSSRKPLHLPE